MDLGLKDKVALVTGAGRGVGRGVCRQLAEEGARVVVNDFHDRRAQRVADELREAGASVVGIEADVTDMEQVRAMTAKAAATLGPIDILVNNAGIPTAKPGEEIRGGWEEFYTSAPEAWVKVIDLNMYGTYHVVMELALTGEEYPAERFHELGLVSRVVPAGKALAAALDLAQRIAASGPLAIAAIKQILAKAHEWTDEEAWPAHRKMAKGALRSKDAVEGSRAFAEKRPPVWRGPTSAKRPLETVSVQS